MSGFKIPNDIPQDLLLIQEMVGLHEPPKVGPVAQSTKIQDTNADDVESSDGDVSEDEIEAKLFEETKDSEPASPVAYVLVFSIITAHSWN